MTHPILTNKLGKIISLLGTRSLATNEMKDGFKEASFIRTE
jgi:hypothetical protein